MAHYTDEEVITEQRSERGLADIDGWNLYSYLEDLSREIVDGISNEEIKSDVDPYFIKTYRELCFHGKHFDSLQDADDKPLIELLNMEALEHHMSVVYMNIFHRAILPTLAFDENWIVPHADRSNSLMNQADYPYAGSFYVKNAIAGIEQIRDRGISIMGVAGFEQIQNREINLREANPEEESDKIRNKIIAELKAFEKSPTENVLNNFCHRFTDLWD